MIEQDPSCHRVAKFSPSLTSSASSAPLRACGDSHPLPLSAASYRNDQEESAGFGFATNGRQKMTVKQMTDRRFDRLS
jgi:hypothetical protein